MQLQFEKREISCISQVLRAVKDQELTQEIRLTEDLPDVGRVLAGWGQAILRGKEWRGSQLAVSGGVQATVLYAPEDGSAPRTVQTWIPFAMKWDGADTDREGSMRVRPIIRFVDGRNLSARKILVRAGVSCLAEALCSRRMTTFCAPEMPEDVQLLRRAYPVRLPKEAGEKLFTIEQNMETRTDQVHGIIACTLCPEVTDARITTDKMALRGIGKLHLVYTDRDGRICARDFDIPFSQLEELENAYEVSAQADVMMAVSGLELDMEEENLSLKCDVVAQYLISDRTVVELTEDAYSTCREVGLRQEELRLPAILDETGERISARVEFADPDLDCVDVQFLPGFPVLRRGEDRVELTLPGRFQLLGYDREGSLRAASAPWEGKTALNADGASRVDAVILPAGEADWLNTAGGVETRAEAQLTATVLSGRGLPMITSLELGAIRENDGLRPTLVLCRSGRRPLWDVAKAAGSSVQAICAANGIGEEMEDDRMLLIPIP